MYRQNAVCSRVFLMILVLSPLWDRGLWVWCYRGLPGLILLCTGPMTSVSDFLFWPEHYFNVEDRSPWWILFEAYHQYQVLQSHVNSLTVNNYVVIIINLCGTCSAHRLCIDWLNSTLCSCWLVHQDQIPPPRLTSTGSVTHTSARTHRFCTEIHMLILISSDLPYLSQARIDS